MILEISQETIKGVGFFFFLISRIKVFKLERKLIPLLKR
jgi:hypothetical protein